MKAMLAALLCVLGLADPGRAEPPAAADSSSNDLPKCVSVRTLAPYRAYGYDHVVEIENGCAKSVNCVVKTDVNPEPTSVGVPPHETRSVLTFRGSPASEFKADVRCKEAG